MISRGFSAFVFVLVAAMIATGCGGPNESKALEDSRKREENEVRLDEGSSEYALEEQGGKGAKETETEAADAEKDAEAKDSGDKMDAGDDKMAKEDAGKKDADKKDAGDDAKESEGEATELDPEMRSKFTSTCGGCHTLADADASGTVGPNLGETTLDAAAIEEILKNGKNAMPAGLVSGDEAAMAEYVFAAAAAS